ncbi:salicylate carboxymethyltransferase-like [Prunus avium]|uniref:Salicylate carboxymethyltransferase-like n=1 Tax=Prunus avium TaxID=42229 RepID=A0A6P5RKA0_PRUAV|nr:salicylate carboxymethyltransferase-like [Prunus avium]
MVLEGLIGEEKLDAFNMPFYTPTTKEIEEVIEAEGSFTLQNLQVFKNDWDSYIKQANSGLDKKTRAAIFATDIRAVAEPILVSQFGEEAMNDLFHRFEDVLDHMKRENCQFINLVISLTKKCFRTCRLGCASKRVTDSKSSIGRAGGVTASSLGSSGLSAPLSFGTAILVETEYALRSVALTDSLVAET